MWLSTSTFTTCYPAAVAPLHSHLNYIPGYPFSIMMSGDIVVTGSNFYILPFWLCTFCFIPLNYRKRSTTLIPSKILQNSYWNLTEEAEFAFHFLVAARSMSCHPDCFWVSNSCTCQCSLHPAASEQDIKSTEDETYRKKRRIKCSQKKNIHTLIVLPHSSIYFCSFPSNGKLIVSMVPESGAWRISLWNA